MPSWRFEISEPLGPMYLPAWLPSLSIVKESSWPYGLAAAYKPPAPARAPSSEDAGSKLTAPAKDAKAAAAAKPPPPAKGAGASKNQKTSGKSKPAPVAKGQPPPKPPPPAPAPPPVADDGPPTGTWLGRIGITWHSEPFEDRTIAARFVKVAGRQFFLVSAPAPRAKPPGAATPAGAPDKAVHTLALLDVDDGLTETIVLPAVEVVRTRALDFAAIAFNDRLVIVYAEGPAIHQLIGTFTHGTLAFTKPDLAWRAPEAPEGTEAPQAPEPISLMRLRLGHEQLHLLWCQGMRLLHSSSTAPWETGWGAPQTVSSAANGANCPDGADMIVDGQDVFVAWSDNRLRGTWDEKSGYDNDLKLFVAASRDHGGTFSTPVLFSDPLNKDEQVDRVFLTLANDKLILCWTEAPKASWRCGVLDRSLRTLEVGTAVHNDKKLFQAYTARMKTHLGEVPYVPPRLPSARRSPMPVGED
jgi:hypothetical protein